MSEKERERVGCMQGMLFVGMLLAFALCLFLSSCKSVEYVTVPEVHNEHHWHTDSVHQTDSIIRETQTTIMQLDSAAMARYGIQLKSAERAWLVKTQEMERQIQMLMQLTQQKDSVHDTVPVPVPVVKEVSTEFTWWRRVRMTLGDIALMVLALLVLIWVTKRYLPL